MTSAFHQSGLALSLFDHKPRLHFVGRGLESLGNLDYSLKTLQERIKIFNSRCLHGRDKKVEYASGISRRHLNSNLKCTSSSRLEGFPDFWKIDYQSRLLLLTLHFHLVKNYLILSLASQVEATKRPYHFKMAR